MVHKIAIVLSKDKKLRTLFSGMVSTGVVLVSLIIAASLMYL